MDASIQPSVNTSPVFKVLTQEDIIKPQAQAAPQAPAAQSVQGDKLDLNTKPQAEVKQEPSTMGKILKYTGYTALAAALVATALVLTHKFTSLKDLQIIAEGENKTGMLKTALKRSAEWCDKTLWEGVKAMPARIKSWLPKAEEATEEVVAQATSAAT